MRRIWLIQKRIGAGYNQHEIAAKIGVAQSLISMIELGKVDPSGKVAARLARELHFDMMMLFPEEKETEAVAQ